MQLNSIQKHKRFQELVGPNKVHLYHREKEIFKNKYSKSKFTFCQKNETKQFNKPSKLASTHIQVLHFWPFGPLTHNKIKDEYPHPT